MTGQTAAESSHRPTDEEESEALVQSGVVSDVEKTLTATTVFVMGKGKYRRVRNAVAELDRDE